MNTYSGISQEQSKLLEKTIDAELKGRSPHSPALEQSLNALIEKLKTDVTIYNLQNPNEPYKGKYVQSISLIQTDWIKNSLFYTEPQDSLSTVTSPVTVHY